MDYENVVERVHELYADTDVRIEEDDEGEAVTVYHPPDSRDWQGTLSDFNADDEGIEMTTVGVAGDVASRIVFEPDK